VGTPVFAANAGIVKMARDLFFSGNIVIIDHGMGVFTNYAHLSRMDVKPGQFVNRGEQIGLAGATGRVNGPHLHWGAKVNGVTVNPNDLIQRMHPLYEDTDPRVVSNIIQSP
jgi:murein DD-endopeptidase MepM/ murein hydrolase activator NlpD